MDYIYIYIYKFQKVAICSLWTVCPCYYIFGKIYGYLDINIYLYNKTSRAKAAIFMYTKCIQMYTYKCTKVAISLDLGLQIQLRIVIIVIGGRHTQNRYFVTSQSNISAANCFSFDVLVLV